MTWLTEVRERTRARVTGTQRPGPPPFDPAGLDAQPAQVLLVEAGRPGVEETIPRGIRIAAAWSWRLILLVGGLYVLIRLISFLRVIVIPVAVAILLAALFQPAAAALRRRGMNPSLAAGLVLVTGLVAVLGSLGLIVQTFVAEFDDLAGQVQEGLDEVQTWLSRGPLQLDDQQLSGLVERAQRAVSQNQGVLTSGALSTAATLGEVVSGFFLVLFTLFFFLRDGGRIWTFLCRLLPQPARVPAARAGHYSWYTLISYVRATVLVAFIDAVGIGIGLFVMDIPLALPLAALVFLGAFIPVVGATLSGIVAVLVALVSEGPFSALVILGVVILVQQIEGNVLEPLIMGRAVALHPLAIILVIAIGIVVAGIVGGLVAVPLLAVANTAVRYLSQHPGGEPTPDREAPGTEPADDDAARAERADRSADDPAAATPPPADSSVDDQPTQAAEAR
ncbi:MAG TPA: AI-2E family transporter [Micromonosporaceae bacterium]|nr:AI-2E family transporter [Micromonosporaceae bacterium]